MTEKVTLSIPKNFDFVDETNNLLLNMSGGLFPEHLSENEVDLLRKRFGTNWFEELGYSEPEYKKPIFLSKIEKAITFAAWSHRGQVDKVGLPYILHPLYVMLQMKTESERVVAVLHDVLEDCPQVSLSDITDRIDMTEEEIGALVALTHIKNEPYVDYLKRVLAAGKIAVNVKWEDVAHNSSDCRMRGLPIETADRMRKKYAVAIDMLWEGR